MLGVCSAELRPLPLNAKRTLLETILMPAIIRGLGAHHAVFGVLNTELGFFASFLGERRSFRATWALSLIHI